MSVEMVLWAAGVSGVICGLAYWRGSLSGSGVVGAVLVGTAVLGFGGVPWAMVLGVFFVSSSALSHFKEQEKHAIAADKFDKGHKRDVGQVFANGGAGAVAAVLSVVWPAAVWWPFFVGAMATATADTWATELGTLAVSSPRLITTGRVVGRGTSGGVTVWGMVVSLAGGLLIGLIAVLFGAGGWFLLLGGLGGLVGSLFDSLLGATVQVVYYSEGLEMETERRVDRLGERTRWLRGWVWFSNDVVNALASVGGGLTAVVLWFLASLW